MKRLLSIFLSAFLLTISFTSCTPQLQDDSHLVITELQASNRTGLMAEDGELYDWIEVSNASLHEVNLKGYALAKDSCRKSWVFPDTLLQPGQRVVVFATKSDLPTQLHCDFKLSSKGDTIQLLSRSGKVLSEVGYRSMKADEVLALTTDSVYESSFRPTPGLPNDRDSYHQYLQLLDNQRTSPLLIWEYVRLPKEANVGTKARRWIELKNVSADTLSLADYALTNQVGDSTLLQLPAQRLAPGALFLFIDSAHVLKNKTIVLQRRGHFADGVNARKAYFGVSMGRLSSRPGFHYTDRPSPSADNDEHSFEDVTPAPVPSVIPGAYKSKNLYINFTTAEGSDVHYTLDGSLPTAGSPVAHDSLLIERNTVVRAFASRQGELPSEPFMGTYIVGAEHTLPVVCVTVNHADFFDPINGIYTKGLHADSIFPHVGANYWKDIERPAHVEFRDSAGGFSYDCGIKIFGGFSRARDKKSFHIKFHSYYGQAKLHYDLYGRGTDEEYNSFVLRSGSQDDIGVMVRDEFFTSLMAPECPTLLVQDYRPVVLYLNGEYWGIYFIREKINKEFVGRHLHADPEQTQLLMQQHLALAGSSRDYISMVNYAIQHDMRDSLHFAYMAKRVDFESLIDFKLGEFYCGNTDAGNIRYCRTTDPRCNGKWHWIYYDLDASFYAIQQLDFYIRGISLEAPISSVSSYNVLINRLLDNPEFRLLFLKRWTYHRQHTFQPEHARAVFDRLISLIQPEMPRNCQRWPAMSYTTWQKHVEHFRQQLRTRLPLLHQDLLRELKVTEDERQSLNL